MRWTVQAMKVRERSMAVDYTDGAEEHTGQYLGTYVTDDYYWVLVDDVDAQIELFAIMDSLGNKPRPASSLLIHTDDGWMDFDRWCEATATNPRKAINDYINSGLIIPAFLLPDVGTIGAK